MYCLNYQNFIFFICVRIYIITIYKFNYSLLKEVYFNRQNILIKQFFEMFFYSMLQNNI